MDGDAKQRVQQKRMTKNFERSTEPREREPSVRTRGEAEYLRCPTHATSHVIE